MDPIRMLVLDRGFVLVCRCPDPEAYALWLPVTDTRTVRRWGTTQGLGELVNGPLTATVLDPLVSAERIPTRAILRVLEVDQAAWKPHLEPAATAKKVKRAAAT